MYRAINLLGGLFLAVNAVYIAYRMYRYESTLMLVFVAPALLAGLVFGVLLVLRAVRKRVEETGEDGVE